MGYVPLYGNDWNVKRDQYDAMKRYLDNYGWHMGVDPENLGFGEDVHLSIDPQETNRSGAHAMFQRWKTNGNVDSRKLTMAAPMESGKHRINQRSWPSIFAHEMFHYQDQKKPVNEIEQYAFDDMYLKKMFGDHWPLDEKTARGADEYFNIVSRPGPHSMVSSRVVDKPGYIEWYTNEDGEKRPWMVHKATYKQVPEDAGISQKLYEEYHDFFNRLYPNRKLRY